MTPLRIALAELQRFSRGTLPKLVMISVLCIPLLYGGVYLYSNWDPYGRTDRITGALVVSDEGGRTSQGEEMNTGKELGDTLQRQKDFDWKNVSDRDEAVRQVREGRADFALVVPKDFTQRLLSSSAFVPDKDGRTGKVDPQKAGLEFITNDANNYILGNIVTSAGTTIKEKLADQVGQQASQQVLASFTTLHGKIQDAGKGSQKITDGSHSLTEALQQLSDGSGSLAQGTRQLDQGASSLASGQDQLVDADRQAVDGATQLDQGAQSLDSGSTTLAQGTHQLATGSQQLAAGTHQLAGSTGQLQEGSGQLVTGTGQLADGTAQLSDGAGKLARGNADLAQGSKSLAQGTSQLRTQLDQAHLGQISQSLRGVCQDLSSAHQGPSSGRLGTDVAQAVVDQAGKDTAEQLAPLVQAGTLTQEQADRIVQGVSGDQARQRAAASTQEVLDRAEAQGPTASLVALQQSSCASTGESTTADRLDALNQGVDRLDQGAQQVSEGADQASTAASRLAQGAQQAEDSTGRLAQGAQQLDDGIGQLGTGAATLDQKTAELAAGAASVDAGAQQLSTGSSTLAQGTGSLVSGSQQLLTGQQQAQTGAAQLAQATGQAAEGAEKLSDGAGKAHQGAEKLHHGSADLTHGLNQGARQIPHPSSQEQDSLSRVMADPVSADRHKLATASTYGAGMAPFFLALALWIGVLMAGQFLRAVNTRAATSNASSLRVALGTWVPFAVVAVGQAVVLYLVVRFALGLPMQHPWLLLWFLLLVSATFSAIAQGFITWLGSPGKLVVLILLILQLVTSGGLMPWETLPGPLRWLHPVLPMSHAITGIRRLVYGIDEGSVPGIVAMLLGYLLLGLVLGLLGTVKSRTWTLKTLHPEVEL